MEGRLSNLTELDLTDNQTRSPPVETAARGTQVPRQYYSE
jgi:Leucine-rich repeat (LRR) protein